MAVVLCVSTAAIAQNSLFLRDSPLASVTGAELDALLNQINVTLDTTDINMPVTWETEDKRLTSVWTVTEDYQKQDLSCRKMTLETVKAGETSRVTYGFCKMDENWLFDLE
ncbi:MAG: hypothetical protein CL401_00065 [Acidiferrobacteraceae bacterium]|nr:hypothetical protein [Acidiferrobacteraceae bacterium]